MIPTSNINTPYYYFTLYHDLGLVITIICIVLWSTQCNIDDGFDKLLLLLTNESNIFYMLSASNVETWLTQKNETSPKEQKCLSTLKEWNKPFFIMTTRRYDD